jgi:hypothetical protein
VLIDEVLDELVVGGCGAGLGDFWKIQVSLAHAGSGGECNTHRFSRFLRINAVKSSLA